MPRRRAGSSWARDWTDVGASEPQAPRFHGRRDHSSNSCPFVEAQARTKRRPLWTLWIRKKTCILLGRARIQGLRSGCAHDSRLTGKRSRSPEVSAKPAGSKETARARSRASSWRARPPIWALARTRLAEQSGALRVFQLPPSEARVEACSSQPPVDEALEEPCS